MSAALPPTLVALRRQIMDGDLTVAEALEAQLAAMKQDTWHSVVTTFPPKGDVAAREQPLAGVGLAHKDIFSLPGHQPGCGARVAPSFTTSASPLITRLDQAGSATLGVLAMAEFAAGITGQNANFPAPVNPIGERYVVGGSSSGSAAAVAAGLCYGSLGTDTAGSIRVPAATCGIFGLKPTSGVLETQGCFPLAPSLDTVGVFARSALDAAVLFSVAMAPEMRTQILPQFESVIGDLGGVAQPRHLPEQPWRIGTVLNHPTAHFSANDGVRDAVMSLAKELGSQPVHHTEPLNDLSDLAKKASTVLHVEAAATHYSRLQAADSEMSDITRAVVVPGAAIPGVWYSLAKSELDARRRQFLDRYFRDTDILLTPVLPRGIADWDSVHTESEHFQPSELLAMFSWVGFVNYLGLPAVVMPVGTDKQGAPVCVQLIGKPFSEATLLAFAHHAEQRLFGASGLVPARRTFFSCESLD